MKVAPLPGFGFDRDRAADLLGETEYLAEAEAGAFAEALGGEEGLEHPLHHLRRHALAGVRNPQRDMLAAEALGLAVQHLVVRADLELAAILHRVARVEGEVEQRELERAGIGVDRPQLVGNFGDHLDVAAQRRPDQGASRRRRTP